jgi:uncharacterized integral membrane protein
VSVASERSLDGCGMVLSAQLERLHPRLDGGGLGVPMGTRLLRAAAAATSPVRPPERVGRVPGISNATSSKSIPSTRAGRAWMRVLPGLVLFAIMLTFVLQNLRTARVTFFAASGTLPLALALLAAAALGALLVLALGSFRIMQLRKLVRHHSRHDRSDRP